MKNIFITGATGFIGSSMVDYFSKDNIVFCMVRPSTGKQMKFANKNIFPIFCDLNDITISELEDCDIIINCAACTNPDANFKEFIETNIEGTNNLIKVAKSAGVKKFIHISSEVVVFQNCSILNGDEKLPYSKIKKCPYTFTKKESEKAVINSNIPNVFETIVFRPRLVWGDGDTSFLPGLLDISKKILITNNGQNKTSTTHIRNLIHGVELAINTKYNGQIYFITDDFDISYKDFIEKSLLVYGVIPNFINYKNYQLLTLNLFNNLINHFNRKNSISKSLFYLDLFRYNCTFSINKIKKELNYFPIVSNH